MRILIVEAQEAWRSILQGALSTTAAQVQFVQSYNASLDALRNGAFDLAIIDLWLDVSPASITRPEKGGEAYDSLEILLEIGRQSPAVPIVIICDSIGRALLEDTPGISPQTWLVERQAFEAETFAAALKHPATPGGVLHPLRSISYRPGFMPPAAGSRQGKPRILIVEDQTFWQDTLARVMEEAGYFWRVASSDELALGRLQLESFHIVLYSLALGDPNAAKRQGWQLLDCLVSRYPKTRLIVGSGYLSSAEMARLFTDYPVKGFVDKHAFDKNGLLAIIRQRVVGSVLRIATLGDFRIWRDGKLVNDYGHELAEPLIKLLIARCGERITVDELTEALWPDVDARSRYVTLGEVINGVCFALEPDLPRAGDSRFILREGDHYRFDITANVEIDSEQLKHLVMEGKQQEARGETEKALDTYKMVSDLYRGDYLPGDRAMPWTMPERTALQSVYTESLNRMADLYARQHKLDMAIKAANQALQIDAYEEATYRRLMRYHACKGDKAAAQSVYKTLVKLFSEFLGEEPGPVTRHVYDEILAGRPVDCIEGF